MDVTSSVKQLDSRMLGLGYSAINYLDFLCSIDPLSAYLTYELVCFASRGSENG